MTGSGKTFTAANVIAQINKPTLVLSHNKTLAAQLYGEFKNFFPENAVEYFVSYYDYYQPEAYLPATDTFIEKDLSINDVIVVSSVSCLYGSGNPEDFHATAVSFKVGDIVSYKQFLYKLVEALYTRTERDLLPATFRVNGDTVDIMAAFGEFGSQCYRVMFYDNEIEAIWIVDPATGARIQTIDTLTIYPARLFVTTKERINAAVQQIYLDLGKQIEFFEREGRMMEAQRIKQRVEYDLEMIKELGYCPGIENYSRYLDGRAAGTRPFCLLDYFPKDFLCIIDESHVTVPQIRGMHEGDRSRKITLAEHGFRLPSCLDNRPLRFDEFEERIPQFVYVSATPGDYEQKVSQQQVEQIIRPTGLLDPEIIVRGSASQIDDIIDESKERAARDERVLITTLTKKMAEDLTDHLLDQGVKARYMHSDIATLERVEILRDLRRGEFDVLVGINLLREGLDLPEVSLVAILDADKEGFLRNHRSLIQTIGRAARNVSGQVIMYADKMTDSMALAIDETKRRRAIQMKYNEEHGIEPQTIRKAINDIMSYVTDEMGGTTAEQVNKELAELSREEVLRIIQSMEDDMASASQSMDFEEAARLRDQVGKLRVQVEGGSEDDVLKDLKKNARKGSAYGNRKNAAYGSARRS